MVLLVSCGKDEQNKLFGKWQLQEVDKAGVIEQTDTVFFNFENSLFMYQIYVPASGGYRLSYGFNVVEKENTLLLELTNNPKPVKDFLPYTDWTSAKRTYQIEKLTIKQLILSSEGKKYTFRKF